MAKRRAKDGRLNEEIKDGMEGLVLLIGSFALRVCIEAIMVMVGAEMSEVT